MRGHLRSWLVFEPCPGRYCPVHPEKKPNPPSRLYKDKSIRFNVCSVSCLPLPSYTFYSLFVQWPDLEPEDQKIRRSKDPVLSRVRAASGYSHMFPATFGVHELLFVSCLESSIILSAHGDCGDSGPVNPGHCQNSKAASLPSQSRHTISLDGKPSLTHGQGLQHRSATVACTIIRGQA